MKKTVFIALLLIAGSAGAKVNKKQSDDNKQLGVYSWFVLHPADALSSYKPDVPIRSTKGV